MKRVALVTPGFTPEFGGIESYVLSLSLELSALGYDVDVLTQCPHGRAAEWSAIEVPGVRVLRFDDWTRTHRFRFSPSLGRYLRKNGSTYDVVHVHNFHAIAAYVACRATDRPMVFSPHYHGPGHTFLAKLFHVPYDRMAKRIFARSSYVLCVSDAEVEKVRTDYPATASRVYKVGAGIDIDAIRGAVPYKLDRPIILLMGRLEAYKHIDLAIAAFAACDCDADMVIIGTGPESSHLRTLADELGVGSRVRMLGYVDDADVIRWQRTASVVMSLSANEAFGLVVAEGAVAGARVVASDIPAHREVAAMAPNSFDWVDLGAKNSEIAEVLRGALRADRLVDAQFNFPTWHEVGVRTSEFYEKIESA